MEKQANELVKAVDPEPARRPNRGWFFAGDPRINRAGRPKGALRAARRAQAGKPLCGRVKTLFVPEQDLRQSLTGVYHPRVTNLPKEFAIVAVERDPNRKGFVLILYSEAFPEVREGEATPQFKPEYHGLKWRNRPPW